MNIYQFIILLKEFLVSAFKGILQCLNFKIYSYQNLALEHFSRKKNTLSRNNIHKKLLRPHLMTKVGKPDN